MWITFVSSGPQEAHLHSLAPVLAPSCLPSKLTQNRDLLALSEREGKRGAQALLEVLTAAADGVEVVSIAKSG